jgi:hypothetical protein
MAAAQVPGAILRTYDEATEKFPPISLAYVSAPPPPNRSFAAKQTGPNQITVAWSGFSPVELARDGTDTSNSGPWSTGPLTNQPTAGTFDFDYLVPGDTYVLTATLADGTVITTQCSVVPPALPTLGINAGTDATSLALMKTLGVKYVRTQITWNYYDEWADNGIPFYNADGSFNTAIIDAASATLTLCESYGITPLFLIDGFISSTAPPAGTGNYTPGAPHLPADYANACAWFIAQLKARGHSNVHIEGPNEPDGYAQWNGTTPFLASDYAITMPLVYNQCKAADPTCQIHIAPVSGVSQGALAWRVALLAALPNFSGYIDKDGWHFYAWPGNEPASTLAGLTQTFIKEASVTKPPWVTEGGFQSLTANSGNGLPEMTPASQATQLVALIELTIGLVEAFFVYCLADYSNPGDDSGTWGLVDSVQHDGDTNVKPAYTAVQALYA